MSAVDKTYRVLLIGAYANGNVGDIYQADAIAAEIRKLDVKTEVFSASPSKRQTGYPTRFHQPLPQATLYEPDKLNEFDVILVGGGGLLAAPHAPLNDQAWVQSITTRICTVSVGAAADTVQLSQPFVERCALFSVRDEYSAASVGQRRSDVEIVMDPILLTDSIVPADTPNPQPTSGIFWIPGKIVDGTTGFYINLVNTLVQERADRLISLNPETDRASGFDDVFPSGMNYIQTWEEFQGLALGRSLGMSERYHGCILAMKLRRPCIGMALRSDTVTSKITELYRRLGLSESIITMKSSMTRSSLKKLLYSTWDFDKLDQRLAEERLILQRYLRRCIVGTSE